MIKIYIPGLPCKSYEYRRGDAQVIHDDEKNAIVIDGGEPDLCNKIIAYCRNFGITHITYILTHWHYDHDAGMKQLLDSSLIVDKIYCPPPSELRGLQESGANEDYSRALRRIAQAEKLGKPIVYPTAGVDTTIVVGKIRCRIWRRKATASDKNDYEINNTSLCTYFPDLYYLTTGDTINSFDIYLSAHPDTVKVFKIPHHGNACTDTPCSKLIDRDAKLCWYNDWEKKGSSVGSSSFSKWGAGFCKKYFITLRTDADISMTASNKTLLVQKGADKWSYAVPYDGKAPTNHWVHGEKGWWYEYADGSYAVGWKYLPWSQGQNWFYFDKNGWMCTGWIYDGGCWYYCDPQTGAMQTGWLDWKGNKCYLEPTAGCNQGHAYQDCTATIDGKTYVFDHDCYAHEVDPSKKADAPKPAINMNTGFRGFNVSSRTRKIEYIVIHYTGAAGTAKNNVDYFNAADRQASADFFVGFQGEIWQYNPDIRKQYSWHCGGGRQSSKGGSFFGRCTNGNSIGIELCTFKNGGVWAFKPETMNAAAQLVRWLMQEYGISIDHVIRHYDVTGKNCPGVPGWGYTGGSAIWEAWKKRLN